jgi:phage/plasmid-associated DNA primase
MIDGCLEWQRVGLNPPKAVTAATEEYLANEDILGQWLADCCEVGRSHSAIRTDLYASWGEWAERNGAPKHSARAFYAKLDDRGFQQRESHGNRLVEGLRLAQRVQEVQEAAYRHVDRDDPPRRALAPAPTPYNGSSCTSCTQPDETGASRNPNACIHCGGHCSPGDTENSIQKPGKRWAHLDCELAQP